MTSNTSIEEIQRALDEAYFKIFGAMVVRSEISELLHYTKIIGQSKELPGGRIVYSVRCGPVPLDAVGATAAMSGFHRVYFWREIDEDTPRDFADEILVGAWDGHEWTTACVYWSIDHWAVSGAADGTGLNFEPTHWCRVPVPEPPVTC